jgi:O-antigen/teichoic acid export membrane protein
VREHVFRLARNTAIYGVGQVAGRLASLLLLPVFTAYLSPAEYGLISMLALLSLVASSLFSLGVGTALGACYFQPSPEARAAVASTAIGLLAFASLVFLAVVAASVTELATLLETAGRVDVIWLACLAACANILSIPFMQVLQFEERALAYVLVSVLSTVTTLGASVLLVVVAGRGVLGWQEGALIGQIVMLLGGAVLVGPRLSPVFSRKAARDLLAVGIPMVPSFAATLFVQQASKYFLQRSHGLGAVGVYSAGFNLGFALAVVVSAFQSAWLAFFMSFRERRAEAAAVLGRVATYYVLGVGGLTLVFFGGAGLAVSVLTRPEYHEAYRAVGLAAAAQFCNGVFLLLLPGVYFNRDVPFVAVIHIAGAVLALGLNQWLVPPHGVPGAALALAGGSLAPAVLLAAWNAAKRLSYVRTEYEWSRLLKFGAAAVPLALATSWPRVLLPWRETLICGLSIAWTIGVGSALLTARERTVASDFFARVLLRRRAWSRS